MRNEEQDHRTLQTNERVGSIRKVQPKNQQEQHENVHHSREVQAIAQTLAFESQAELQVLVIDDSTLQVCTQV